MLVIYFVSYSASPQDDTTGECLDAAMTPLPTWVFSAKFPLEKLKENQQQREPTTTTTTT